jgi:hypothetical protein
MSTVYVWMLTTMWWVTGDDPAHLSGSPSSEPSVWSRQAACEQAGKRAQARAQTTPNAEVRYQCKPMRVQP